MDHIATFIDYHYATFLLWLISYIFSITMTCADRRKHQSTATPAFVRGIHRWSVHKRSMARKLFSFDNDIMSDPYHILRGGGGGAPMHIWRTTIIYAGLQSRKGYLMYIILGHEQRWPSFFRQHIQMHFIERRVSYFASFLLKFRVSNWYQVAGVKLISSQNWFR